MTIQEVIPKVENVSRYKGQWVVICNDEVVAHNKDLTKIKEDINKCRVTPTVAKIPEKDILIF